ncbi:unnamed protein product [Nezara viridula]|uniref:Uncharacterized protein n=1 Tax=Nezara viridula TaxID=85310 RepID=A0A9P0HMR1_NEZVI|nr:unnamed protein product [Nezara viridula]
MKRGKSNLPKDRDSKYLTRPGLRPLKPPLPDPAYQLSPGYCRRNGVSPPWDWAPQIIAVGSASIVYSVIV